MNLVCSEPGCERNANPDSPPELHDVIWRTSPKGDPFEGMCSVHYTENRDKTIQELTDAILRRS